MEKVLVKSLVSTDDYQEPDLNFAGWNLARKGGNAARNFSPKYGAPLPTGRFVPRDARCKSNQKIGENQQLLKRSMSTTRRKSHLCVEKLQKPNSANEEWNLRRALKEKGEGLFSRPSPFNEKIGKPSSNGG